MLRSMYTGISGMQGFQTKLDVVSNNIANVNTFGYKKGRSTFQDLMSQTMQGAQAATPGPNPGDDPVLGGRNPMQVGLGVSTGSVDTIHTQGNRQTTNRPLDLAIEGDGMFRLQDGDNELYSRAGNFYLDQAGDIVNANGNYLLNVAGDKITIPQNAQSFSITPNGSVNIVDVDGEANIVGQISLANFSNPEGLEKVGGNLFRATNNSGEAQNGAPGGDNGTGNIFPGALEMSNVDLAEEFTEMITAQRGFQANTRVITTSDEILQELVNLKR